MLFMDVPPSHSAAQPDSFRADENGAAARSCTKLHPWALLSNYTRHRRLARSCISNAYLVFRERTQLDVAAHIRDLGHDKFSAPVSAALVSAICRSNLWITY